MDGGMPAAERGRKGPRGKAVNGVMRRCELRFGLLGPPVLYDRAPYGISYDAEANGEAGADTDADATDGVDDPPVHDTRTRDTGDRSGAAPSVRAIGSPKVRALLAALLLEADRVVSVDSLKDALWGGAPPASARASLHNHVTRLRRLLDDPERLRAVPPGYRLRVDDGELDVHVFDARVGEARAAHGRRDWTGVLRACTAALTLWRGAPLSGLPAELGGYALAQRLEEARLLLLEWRYDAELGLGGPRPAALVPELAALVAEHPLRESFHRQLMLALHRTGRQAEALAVHRDLRTRLVGELGVEPGPAVRRAHLEVLRETGDPAAAGSGAGEGPYDDPYGGVHGDAYRGSHRAAHGDAREGFPGGSPDGHPRAGEGPFADGGRGDGREGLRLPRVGGERTDAETPTARQGGEDVHPGSPAARQGREAARQGGEAARSDREAAHQGGEDVHPGREDVHPGSEVAHPGSEVAHPGSEVAHPNREVAHPGQEAAHPGQEDGSPSGKDSPGPSSDPGATGEDAVPAVRTPRPAQLPPPPAHFTGRRAVLHDLRRALTAPGADGSDTRTPVVAVISGMAGVGKSALALRVAHDLRKRFPDGQLYVNLHGATPGMSPLPAAQALGTLLRDLGADPRSIPEHPDAAAASLRSMLAPTRTLMVLDDAANAAQLRPLLPAGAGCAVIVTSRSPLTALDGARRFPLAPLTGEDSAELLRTVSGRDGLDAGHPLVELTGRLPLALRVVAARLAARRALTPDALAGQLAATEGRLHQLEYDDLSVRRSLAVAHDALSASVREADRDAARALRRIGALDLPSYGAALVARLTGTDERRAEAALDRLVDVALLEETAYGRYAPHDLVRDFARELTGDGEDTAVAGTALRWYAAVAERTLTAIVEPGLDRDDRRRPTAAQPPAHAADVRAVASFSSAEEAFAWGDRELQNIVALAERYAETPDERQAAHLSTLLRLFFPYVQRSGRVAEMEVLGRAALGSARRLGDEAAEAYALGDLAGLHFLTGRQGDALALTDRALTIWRRLGRVSWIRRCLNNRGLLLEGLGRYAESGDALRQSLEYSRQLDDPYGEAITYSHLGNLYEHTDPRAAIEQHRRSLAIGDTIGAVIVQHSAHCNIGYAHLALGEPDAAAVHFEESLRILGGHGDWHGESQTRLGLVRALRQLGRTGRAGHECAELLRRADARADRYVGGLARHQHGFLLRETGRVREAYGVWREALAALDGTDENTVVAELRELLGGDG